MVKYLVALFFTLFVCLVQANTEKIILQVREADELGCDSYFAETHQLAPSLKRPFTEHQNSIIPQPSTQSTVNWYQLHDLKEGSNYEIRISYPAITPADFNMNLANRCRNKNNNYDYILKLTATYTGVSQIEGMEHQPVIYNIVLENLYLGFLFYNVYKIVLAIVLVLVLGQFVFIPYIKKLFISKTASKIE